MAREALAQAEGELRDRHQATADAEALKATATDPAVVSVDAPIAGSALPAMVRAGGAAALITGIAGVGLISAFDRRKRAAASIQLPGAIVATATTTPTSQRARIKDCLLVQFWDQASSSSEDTAKTHRPPRSRRRQLRRSTDLLKSWPTRPSTTQSKFSPRRSPMAARGQRRSGLRPAGATAKSSTQSTQKPPVVDKAAKTSEPKAGPEDKGPADRDNGRTAGLFQGRDRSEGNSSGTEPLRIVHEFLRRRNTVRECQDPEGTSGAAARPLRRLRAPLRELRAKRAERIPRF